MKFSTTLAAAMLGISALTTPSVADAHSKVTSSTPAAGSTVPRPRVIVLNFSEALLTPTASVSIVMTAMPGMADHGEMLIKNFTPVWSNGNRTLTLNLKSPLPTGSYDIRWKAAGADGHRMSGTISFKTR